MSERIKNIAKHRQNGEDRPFSQPLEVITADTENTTAWVNAIKVTIPAGEWKDGETISIRVFGTSLNNSGVSISFYERWYWGGTLLSSRSQYVTTNTAEGAWAFIFHATRVGDTIWFTNTAFQDPGYLAVGIRSNIAMRKYWLDTSSRDTGRRTAQTFSADKDIIFKLRWTTADPNAYVRIEKAVAFKTRVF